MWKLDKHRMYHFTLQASAWMDGYMNVIISLPLVAVAVFALDFLSLSFPLSAVR